MEGLVVVALKPAETSLVEGAQCALGFRISLQRRQAVESSCLRLVTNDEAATMLVHGS